MAAALFVSCTESNTPTAVQAPTPSLLSANLDRSPSAERTQPPIRHVFVLVLENENFDQTFGPSSPATFLADTLPKRGALLTQYFGTGHFSLDNYISMISGQAPDSATSADCGIYTNFVQTGTAPFGQAVGSGCVYPTNVRTVANQLTERGLRWRAYMEDMGNVPTREAPTCGHVPIGTADITNRALPNDQYADRHNPFVYFHSIIDSPICQEDVVPLTRLEGDLRDPGKTPDYIFITPNVCHDGHDAPCVDGEPGGLVSADAFLRTWVPRITSSRAFQDDGLLLIIFDEAAASDASACCNEQPGPNQALPGRTGPGGGRTGAVLLSKFIKGGTVSNVGYNHYSMLKSVEDIFRLPYLGFAGQPGLVPFGADVFTQPNPNRSLARSR
jgi:hypothetical protein